MGRAHGALVPADQGERERELGADEGPEGDTPVVTSMAVGGRAAGEGGGKGEQRALREGERPQSPEQGPGVLSS